MNSLGGRASGPDEPLEVGGPMGQAWWEPASGPVILTASPGATVVSRSDAPHTVAYFKGCLI